MGAEAERKTIKLPELARLAGVLPDTLRMWYRRGYLGDTDSGGWRRYAFKEAAQIVFYAEVLRKTQDHEIASKSVESFVGYVSALANGFKQDGCWLVLYRKIETRGILAGELVLRSDEIESEEVALTYVKELLDGTTFFDEVVCPTIIPIERMWLSIVDRLSEVFGASETDGDL